MSHVKTGLMSAFVICTYPGLSYITGKYNLLMQIDILVFLRVSLFKNITNFRKTLKLKLLHMVNLIFNSFFSWLSDFVTLSTTPCSVECKFALGLHTNLNEISYES